VILYWSVPAAVALLQALMVGRYLSTAKPGTTRTEFLGTVLAMVLIAMWVGCGTLFFDWE
jgi:uncharacterized membrane protein